MINFLKKIIVFLMVTFLLFLLVIIPLMLHYIGQFTVFEILISLFSIVVVYVVLYGVQYNSDNWIISLFESLFLICVETFIMGYMASNTGDKSNYTAYTKWKEIVESIPFNILIGDGLTYSTIIILFIILPISIWGLTSGKTLTDEIIKKRKERNKESDDESVVVATYTKFRK